MIVARVAALQTTEADAYRAQGAAQWTRTWEVPAQRGTIFDRNGNEMAISVPAATISINPKLIENGPATIQTARRPARPAPTRRSPNCSAEVDSKERGFVYVARQVDCGARRPDLRASSCPASTSIARTGVRCPAATPDAASSAGPTSTASGIAGLELQYDDMLSGTGGEMSREVAPGGPLDPRLRDRHRGADRRRRPRAHDRSVDPVLHRAGAAREGVARSVPAAPRRSSWIPHTGEIYAMASVRLQRRDRASTR